MWHAPNMQANMNLIRHVSLWPSSPFHGSSPIYHEMAETQGADGRQTENKDLAQTLIRWWDQRYKRKAHSCGAIGTNLLDIKRKSILMHCGAAGDEGVTADAETVPSWALEFLRKRDSITAAALVWRQARSLFYSRVA